MDVFLQSPWVHILFWIVILILLWAALRFVLRLASRVLRTGCALILLLLLIFGLLRVLNPTLLPALGPFGHSFIP